MTNPEHMPPQHKWMHDWNPERFKSWADSMGTNVRLMVDQLLSRARHEEQAFKACMGLLNIPDAKYSKQDVDQACRRALSYGQYGYKVIKSILKNNLHTQPLEQDLSEVLPDHENVRGGCYYNLEITI
jgi:hypothetical protein